MTLMIWLDDYVFEKSLIAADKVPANGRKWVRWKLKISMTYRFWILSTYIVEISGFETAQLLNEWNLSKCSDEEALQWI